MTARLTEDDLARRRHENRCDTAAERALLLAHRVREDDPRRVREWLHSLDLDGVADVATCLAAWLPQGEPLPALQQRAVEASGWEVAL